MKLRSFQPDGKPKTEAFKNLSFLNKDVKFLWNLKMYNVKIKIKQNGEMFMSCEEKIQRSILSGRECSLEEAEEIMKDLSLNFFLDATYNIKGSCILASLLIYCQQNLLKAFHNKFKNDVTQKTQLILGKEEKNLIDVLLYYYGYKINSKGYVSLFLNDIKFIGDGEKIFINTEQHYKKDLIRDIIGNNDDNLFLSLFHFFEDYESMVLTLINRGFKNIEECKKNVMFLDIPLPEIMNKIHLPEGKEYNFDDFAKKKYPEVIVKNPDIFTSHLNSMDVVKYIYSLLNSTQKKELLKNIQKSSSKKGNFRFDKYDVTYKGYTMISAIKNDCIDFIKFMLNEGYELNDFEKVEIKKQGFQDELPGFEDNLVIELNEKTKNDSDEEKFAFALKYFADKKIIQQDFLHFIETNIDVRNLSIDRNNLSFNHKFTAINIQKDYQSNNYSAVDALINLGFFRPLFKIDLRNLTIFQKEFIKTTLINKVLECHMEDDYEKAKVIAQEIAKIDYKKIEEEISDTFITEIYKRIFEKQEIPSVLIEEVLSSVISDEELESNRSFLLGYSYPMFERYTKDNKRVPSDNEIAHLNKCIRRNIDNIFYRFAREYQIENRASWFNILMSKLQNNIYVTPQVLERVIEYFKDDEQVRNRIFLIIENKKINSVLQEKVNEAKIKKRL